ncbi:MAG TPA: DsrE family protein [Sulfuricaulis sp.]
MGRLGILVNSDRHGQHVLGLAQAARSLGHEVSVFFMDAGTRLLRDADILKLAEIEGVRLSLCQHSAAHHKIETEGLPPSIVRGSQLNNAMMQHAADRVVVL